MQIPQLKKTALFLVSISLFCFLVAFIAPDEDPSDNIPPDIRELLDLAEDMRCMGNYKESVQYLEKAQASYFKKGNELAGLELFSKILWMPIDPDFETSDFLKRCSKSEPKIKAKLTVYPQLEAILELANIQKNWIDDDLDAGAASYKRLLEILKKYPNWDYAAAGASYLASAYVNSSDELPGRKYAELSNQLIKKNSNNLQEKNPHLYRLYPYCIYYNHYNIAYLDLFLEESKDAPSEIYSAALNSLKQQKIIDSVNYTKTLMEIGYYYRSVGDHDKSFEYYENALVNIPKRHHLLLASCHKEIGDVLTASKTIAHYQKSIEYLDKEKNPSPFILQKYSDTYRSIATDYVHLQKYDSCKIYLEKIAKLPPGSDRLPSWTYATWGFMYEHTKEYDKSIEAHEKSISAYLNEGISPSSAYWNLGKIAYANKDYKLSVEYFHKSLLEKTQGSATNFWECPKLDDIPDKYSASITLDLQLRSYCAYVEQNNLWKEHGQHVLDLANLTVDCFEFMRNSFDNESAQKSLLSSAYETYEQAIFAYLSIYEQNKDQQYLKKAIEFAEKSKSVLLESALKEQNASSFGGIPDSLIEQEQLLIHEITLIEKDLYLAQKEKNETAITSSKKALFELKKKTDKLKHIFEKNYPKYYALKYEKTAISIDQIQQALAPNTSILEYFEGYDYVFAFCISHNKIDYLRIPVVEGYTEKFKQLRNALSSSSLAIKNPTAAYDAFVNQAHDFHNTFVQNIVPKGTTRLIIIPDGLLNYVAFEAIINKKPDYSGKQTAHYQNLSYLMNEYSISYNYSAMMWLSQLNAPLKATNNQLLAMAAAYGKEYKNANSSTKMQQIRNSLSPIPGTVEEINFLQQKYAGTFYTKELANEAQFKEEASNYGILHLAMHGLSDNEHPEFSSMAFTENGDNLEDNFLHINEIKQLNLNANLVVLSACETGFGKYQAGEGVVSLGRSFMYAGAPSIVMTLWNINDYSSVLIIQLFYENLQQGMEKDVALQKAKQDYLKNTDAIASHPAFWAAFVQLGDYKPIAVQSKSNIPSSLIFAGLGLVLGLGLLAYYYNKNKKQTV